MQDTLDLLEVDVAERTYDRAIARWSRAEQPETSAEDPAWQPAPGAQPFFICGGNGQIACLPPQTQHRSPTRARLNPAVQSVITYLDAVPDLAGRWRRVNVDPAFLEWLDQVDPLAGQKRAALLRSAYFSGDAKRTAAFFRAYITESKTSAIPTYTYIPTEQDRAEIRACVAAAGRNTSETDCLMPSLSRITSAMFKEIDSRTWPDHPSQMGVMIQSAGLKCGMPIDRPEAPVPHSEKPCLKAEVKKAAAAVVLGLHDFFGSVAPRAP